MKNEKEKYRVKRYWCWYCHCTGFFSKKQTIFKIWNWGYQFIDKQICKYCDGKGFVVFKRKLETENNYQSFLEH